MKNLGQVFKYFRVNQHYSLVDAAKKDISVSQLSRFERGDSDLSISKFFDILDNINLPIEEFMHVARDFKKHEIIEIMSKCITYHYERNVEGFEQLKNQLKDYLIDDPDNSYIRRNIILIEGFMCQCDSSRKMPKEYINEISDYLFVTEDWNVHELILVGNLFEFFSSNLLNNITQELINRRDRLLVIGTTAHLLILTLLNIFLEYCQRNKLKEAKFVRDKFFEVMPNETKTYERVIFLYCNGFFDYKLGKKEGILKMKNAIEIFDILDCKNLANNYIDHYKKHVKNA